jgi:cytochrome c oxidase cbb3-type subunit I/II
MLVVSFILVAIGGAIEMVPTFLIKSNVPTIASVKPYTPLELHGRDIYIREGCYTCHSQMIRPFRSETVRYGEYSKAGEFVYDHPFQWGSKRTGPDLAREGGKRPDSWHYYHMYDPTSTSDGSLMPPYRAMYTNLIPLDIIPAKIRAMQNLGVPYAEGFDELAVGDLQAQAAGIAANLKENGIDADPNTEIIALIAYLQRLGTDISRDAGATAVGQVNP